ncbi:MAG: DUF456 family protein [Verrucomicrobiae bacterium]|nr:DUF456 family protein [Verrucomicrobiae bacterium]
MNFVETIGLASAWLIMLIGVVGSVIPAIPSTTLVLLAAVAHKLWFGEASVSVAGMTFLVVVTVLSLVLDYLATMIGAKRLGATWKGILGSCVGAVLGAFIPIFFVGIFIGTFVGAVLFEMIGGREAKEAARAGLGALIGLLAGALGKLAASIAMIAVFTISVFANTLGREEPIPETLPALIESVGAESPTNAAPGTVPAAAATRK